MPIPIGSAPNVVNGLPQVNVPDNYHPGPRCRLRFWAIFIGQALSLLGSALTQFVLLWWVADTTGSISALAAAGMAALLPLALLCPLGGTCADRYSRRLLMIGAHTISALCMMLLIALFLTGGIELWHVYTMMSLRSAMQAFQTPAAAASMAMLVPRSLLPWAVGLNQIQLSATIVTAGPLGAFAMNVLPLSWALSIDVSTALLGIVPLMIFHLPQVRAVQLAGTYGVWNVFREGMHLVWTDPGLYRLYCLLGVVVLVITPSCMLVPLLVKQHYAGGAFQVALMEGLSGIGMVAGSMAVTAIAPRRQMPWILWGFAGSCFSLSLTALAPGNLFGIAVTWWVVSGMTFILGNAPLAALLQSILPNHLKGHVLSLLSMVMGISALLGLLIATQLGELIGVRWLFVLMGGFGGLVSLSCFMSPTLICLDRRANSGHKMI
ncbi:TPA: MFS transporter [Yersinia enterocolitica]